MGAMTPDGFTRTLSRPRRSFTPECRVVGLSCPRGLFRATRASRGLEWVHHCGEVQRHAAVVVGHISRESSRTAARDLSHAPTPTLLMECHDLDMLAGRYRNVLVKGWHGVGCAVAARVRVDRGRASRGVGRICPRGADGLGAKLVAMSMSGRCNVRGPRRVVLQCLLFLCLTACVPITSRYAQAPAPDTVRAVRVQDLGVRLALPGRTAEVPMLLGLDGAGRLLALMRSEESSTTVLRFDVMSGRGTAISTLPDHRSPERLSKGGAALVGGHALVTLRGDSLFVYDANGMPLASHGLPASPEAIIATSEGLVYVAVPESEGAVSVHAIDVETGAWKDLATDAVFSSGLVGVPGPSRSLLVVQPFTYEVFSVSVDERIPQMVLQQSAASLGYLQGAYERFQVTAATLVEMRFLWLWIRLEFRSVLLRHGLSAGTGDDVRSQGLLEVWDLRRRALVARRFVDDLASVAGPVQGTLAFRQIDATQFALLRLTY